MCPECRQPLAEPDLIKNFTLETLIQGIIAERDAERNRFF